MAAGGGTTVVTVDLLNLWLNGKGLRAQLGGGGPSDLLGALFAVSIGAFCGNGHHCQGEGRATATVLHQNRLAPVSGTEEDPMAAGNP